MDLVNEKSEHHKENKDFAQMFFAESIVVIEVIALVFQGIKRFILNLPPRTSAPHKLKDIFFGDGQVGNPK